MSSWQLPDGSPRPNYLLHGGLYATLEARKEIRWPHCGARTLFCLAPELEPKPGGLCLCRADGLDYLTVFGTDPKTPWVLPESPWLLPFGIAPHRTPVHLSTVRADSLTPVHSICGTGYQQFLML